VPAWRACRFSPAVVMRVPTEQRRSAAGARARVSARSRRPARSKRRPHRAIDHVFDRHHVARRALPPCRDRKTITRLTRSRKPRA
jgi:hypothetical protein